MANFATHLNVAAFVSGVGAAALNAAGIIDKPTAFLAFGAGIIGGILPDIDHNYSTPTKIMQYFFANLFAFIVLFKYIGYYPIYYSLGIWIVSYIFVLALFYLFKQFTTHRGIFHSIPMGFLFGEIFVTYSYFILHLKVLESYFIGAFVFLGFLTHLILDEIFSVDIKGARLKQSFGTAFKLWGHNKLSNFIVYALILIFYFFLPAKHYILKVIENV